MVNLTDEERTVGRDNYYSAVSAHDQMHRRDFLVKSFAAGGVSAAGVGAMYFGYGRPDRRVRVCVIGTGDQGGVLIGAINPNVFQAEDPKAMIQAVRAVVHDCETPEKAFDLYNALKNKKS